MGGRTSKVKSTDSQSDRPVIGDHPKPYCAASGRRPGACIDSEVVARAFSAFIRDKFGHLAQEFNQIPDPRVKIRCRYTPSELLWTSLLMFINRTGSRNRMDVQRNSGYLPEAIAGLAGRGENEMPVDGRWLVSCSDNIVRFLNKVPVQRLEEVQLNLVKQLFKARVFDNSRLDDTYYRIIIDGSIREKCRKGGKQGGKKHGKGHYRYVLQASIMLYDHLIPIMQEHIDVENPDLEKEDCEINAARRLLPRLKEAFPRTPFVIIGDALYACRPVAEECLRLGWLFCFTFKEGRTPTVWQEAMTLMDITPENKLEYCDKPNAAPHQRQGSVRWVENMEFSGGKSDSLRFTAIEQLETFKGVQTRYAWISNIPKITQKNVLALVNATGRERHQIEDQFNTLKNNGIGMGHVFCAEVTVSKNLYCLMQMAYALWILFYHGLLKRICERAKTWTQTAVAQLLSEGLRILGNAPPGLKVGQLRFVT